MTTCKNCGHQFDFDFCNKCGQKASIKRIEIKWLLHELPHAIWHIEKGFLYNVVQLFKRPGYAVVDYIEGKRKNFFHPISYIMITLAAMYLIAHYLVVHWYDPVQDAGMSKGATTYWKDYEKSQQLWTSHYFQYMAIYLPVASLIFWVLLRWMHRKYNYAESVVVTIFLLAQNIIPQAVVFFVTALVDKTAFTRTADNMVIGFVLLLFIFQLYQLGDTGITKTRRLVTGILGAVLLISWMYAVLYIQTAWLN